MSSETRIYNAEPLITGEWFGQLRAPSFLKTVHRCCVVSDSGTLPEESDFFSRAGHAFPAVCIRTSTERPEAMEKGAFILKLFP